MKMTCPWWQNSLRFFRGAEVDATRCRSYENMHPSRNVGWLALSLPGRGELFRNQVVWQPGFVGRQANYPAKPGRLSPRGDFPILIDCGPPELVLAQNHADSDLHWPEICGKSLTKRKTYNLNLTLLYQSRFGGVENRTFQDRLKHIEIQVLIDQGLWKVIWRKNTFSCF